MSPVIQSSLRCKPWLYAYDNEWEVKKKKLIGSSKQGVGPDNSEIQFKVGKSGSAVCWENTTQRHLLFRYPKNGFPVSCYEDESLELMY